MTDKEIKKPGLIKKLFYWLGVSILSLAIIACIIFQAPLKVTLFFLIFLLARTALPRQLRKWYWLTVATVVVILTIWVFLPDSGQWKTYSFDEEVAALEAKRAIPAEEDAAIIYNQLMAETDVKNSKPDSLDEDADNATESGPWLSKDYPGIAKWMKTQQETIDTLLKATNKPYCRFPISADISLFGETMDILGTMRHWANLLVRAGNNDIAEGRTDEALEKYFATLNLARHNYQQFSNISFLVGLGIERLGVRHLRHFVLTGDPTDAHLILIEDALAEIKPNWKDSFARLLELEKLYNKNLMGFFYEIDPKGRIRLNRHGPVSRTEMAELGIAPPTYLQTKLTKAHVILRWFVVPSTPQKFSGIVDKSYEPLYAMAEPGYDWQKRPEEIPFDSFIDSIFSTQARLNISFMSKLMAEASKDFYYKFHDLYLRNAAEQIGLKIAIALRRYKDRTGSWPESLEEIQGDASAEIFIDPINNGNFVYKLTEEGFRLYSRGQNDIDEDGEYDIKFNDLFELQKPNPDDLLIWPITKPEKDAEDEDAEE